ncbi:hypothetical protein GWI33_017721 [Rhynchophorus ferrugineus]|uniref:Uncharacterized protein n=1 Tax=Rhynchophorus ferrugineus TaxID=354439 RepID=A0A834M7E4_RHYFE|nr:hypothetical protein GWI33_017721 [Rhynchophorus ferrugineus]
MFIFLVSTDVLINTPIWRVSSREGIARDKKAPISRPVIESPDSPIKSPIASTPSVSPPTAFYFQTFPIYPARQFSTNPHIRTDVREILPPGSGIYGFGSTGGGSGGRQGGFGRAGSVGQYGGGYGFVLWRRQIAAPMFINVASRRLSDGTGFRVFGEQSARCGRGERGGTWGIYWEEMFGTGPV